MPSEPAQKPEPSIDSFRSLLSKAKTARLVRQLKQNRKRRCRIALTGGPGGGRQRQPIYSDARLVSEW